MFAANPHFIPKKKSACGVRTGLEKEKSKKRNKCLFQNRILSQNKKRLRRTHWLQKKEIMKQTDV